MVRGFVPAHGRVFRRSPAALRLRRGDAALGGLARRSRPRVTEVRTSGPHVEVVYADAGGEVVGVRARAAVFALPRFLAPYLVDGWAAKKPAVAESFVYGSWMVANLTLSDRPKGRGFPL